MLDKYRKYPSLCWLVKRYKILTNHEALKEEMLVEVKNLKTQICHYKIYFIDALDQSHQLLDKTQLNISK